MEDSSEGGQFELFGPAQEDSEGRILASGLKSFRVIFSKNEAAFCPCPKKFA